MNRSRIRLLAAAMLAAALLTTACSSGGDEKSITSKSKRTSTTSTVAGGASTTTTVPGGTANGGGKNGSGDGGQGTSTASNDPDNPRGTVDQNANTGPGTDDETAPSEPAGIDRVNTRDSETDDPAEDTEPSTKKPSIPDPNFDSGQLVIIEGNRVLPAVLVAEAEKPISFRNNSGRTIVLVSPSGLLASTAIAPGATWDWIADGAGSIRYTSDDGTLEGRVQVEPAEPTT